MRLVTILFLTFLLPLPSLAQTSPRGEQYEVWVTDQQNDSVWIIDGVTLKLIAEIKLDQDGIPATTKPHSIAFTPDGRYALTANIAAQTGKGNVSVIRTKDREVILTLPAGPAAHMVVVAPNGSRAFIANVGGSTVREIIVDSQKEIFKPGRILSINAKTGDPHPTCLSISADSHYLFVTNSGAKGGNPETSGFISLIDIPSGKEIKRFSGLGSEVCAQGISPDGDWAYFTIGGKVGQTAGINIKRQSLARKELPAGKDPHGLAASLDGQQLWITNRLATGITVVDPVQFTTLRKIDAVGDMPDLIAFSPDGSRAFVTLRGKPATPIPGGSIGLDPGVSVVDTESGKILKRIPIKGGDPHGIAILKSF